jgi:hypothetical protein
LLAVGAICSILTADAYYQPRSVTVGSGQEPYLATHFSALLLLASYDVDHFGVAQVRRIAANIAKLPELLRKP